MKPPLSRFRAGLRVGPTFFDRARIPNVTKRGVVDAIGDLSNDGIDASRVHPDVRVFFEDTGSLELFIRSHWRAPISAGWWVMRRAMRLIGQLVLPLREARILTRVFALDPKLDGRPNPRAVIRTYEDSGEVMQAIAYTTWDDGPTRYMSAAFPLPLSSLIGILRLDAIAEDEQGRLAVELTSRRRALPGGEMDNTGIWLSLPGVTIPMPFREEFELWAAAMPNAPPEIDPRPKDFPGATILGLHRQWLFGVHVVTHHYWFRPLAAKAEVARTDADRDAPCRSET